jgi:hypothetical protein
VRTKSKFLSVFVLLLFSILTNAHAIDFGEVGVGKAATWSGHFTGGIWNGQQIVMKSETITGPDAADFSLSTNYTGVTMPYGKNFPFVIKFTPSRVGVETGYLAIVQTPAHFGSWGWALTGTGVPVAPRILAIPPNQAIRQGGALLLSVQADGTPPLFYQWHEKDALSGTPQDILGATNATLRVTNIQSPEVYSFTVSNAAGSIISPGATTSVYFVLLDSNRDVNWGWKFATPTSFRVQKSSNIVNWTSIGTNIGVEAFVMSITNLFDPEREFFRLAPYP